MSQRLWTASRSWKRQRNRFSLENLQKEVCIPADTDCSPARSLQNSDLQNCWTSDLQNCKIIDLYCLSPQVLGICYNSHIKLIQLDSF